MRRWLASSAPALAAALLVGAVVSAGPSINALNRVMRTGDTMTGQLIMSTGTTLAVDASGTGAGFRTAAASGTNGFACTTDGCRFDFGSGASDYASSDATTVTFAGPLTTSGAFSATTGGFSGLISRTGTGAGFTAATASGTNAYAVTVNGARYDFGDGASDYLSGDGTTITSAGPFAVTGALSATTTITATTDINLAGNDLTATGTAQSFNIVSATADTTTSSTVAAITLSSNVNITDADLLFELNNSAGDSIMSITEAGTFVALGGATAASFTTAGNGNVTASGSGSLSAGSVASNTIGSLVNAAMTFSGWIADSATAEAIQMKARTTLATPGAVIVGFYPNDGSARRSSIDFLGFHTLSSPHPSLGRQMGEYTLISSGDTVYNYFNLPTALYAASETKTVRVAATGATRKYMEHASSAVIDTAGGIVGPYTITRPVYRPKMTSVVLTDAAITLRRVYVGLADSSTIGLALTTSTAATGIDYVAVGFDTAIDASWLCCSGDGTNHGCSDTAVDVATSTEYRLSVDWTTAGTLRCCVGVANGVPTCVNKTSNLSTAAVDLGIQNTVTSLEAVTSKSTFIASTTVEQN